MRQNTAKISKHKTENVSDYITLLTEVSSIVW